MNEEFNKYGFSQEKTENIVTSLRKLLKEGELSEYIESVKATPDEGEITVKLKGMGESTGAWFTLKINQLEPNKKSPLVPVCDTAQVDLFISNQDTEYTNPMKRPSQIKKTDNNIGEDVYNFGTFYDGDEPFNGKGTVAERIYNRVKYRIENYLERTENKRRKFINEELD